MFQYNMVRTINKPTRKTRNTTTAIDHIIANTVICGIPGMIKTDISHHFPIVFAFSTCEKSKPENKANLFVNASTSRMNQVRLNETTLLRP